MGERPQQPPVLVVTGRRRPHEVMLLAVSVILGVTYLAGAPRPGSVNDLLPDVVFYSWALALVVTGTAGLTACFSRPGHTEAQLELERGALVAQAGALILYGTVVITYAGFGALVSATIVAGWAVANAVRAAQITKDLRSLR